MQIQLTEEQARSLRRIAAQRGESIAAVVRGAVSRRIADEEVDAIWERALGVVGAFASGRRETSVEHDRHLAEAYAEHLR